MLNAIASEFVKIKKNKMAWIGTGIVVLLPLLLILKSLFLDRQRGVYMDWFQIVLVVNTLVLPVVSGFVITTIIQKEYQDKTLRNILNAPTSREHFVIAKLVVWFLWYLFTLCLAEIIVIVGFRILFPAEFTSDNLQYTIYLFTQSSLFSFVAMIPVLWIALKQQLLFYPSILATLGFTVLEVAGRQVSEELILPAIICPWTAVSIAEMVSPGTKYFLICCAAIFLCGAVSVCAALFEFKKKQDQ